MGYGIKMVLKQKNLGKNVASFVTREMHIKLVFESSPHSIRMANNKKTTTSVSNESARGHLYGQSEYALDEPR